MTWWTDDSPIPDPLDKGARAVKFIELLKLHEGRLAGQRFRLARWQQRIVRRVYGDTRDDGRRKVKTVFILLPRGNGKTTLSAALGLLHLIGPEKDPAGQVVAAAADREQASIAYNAAAGMIAQDRTLVGLTRINPSYKVIHHPKSRSRLMAVSHEAYSKHGMSVSCLIADEVHAWPKREIWDVLRQSMGKRDDPLTIVITTAGAGVHGLAFDLYDYAKKVASGEVVDETFLPILYEADKDADWRDEEVWKAVNPALADGFRSLEEMRISARQATEIPAQREAFKRYYLNIWSDGAPDPWLDMELYDKGGAPIDADALEGRACWLGVDLSSTQDLTAVVAAFADDDGGYTLLPWFFCPADNLAKRQERDQIPYLRWAEEGHLIPTPGNVVDFGFVEETIAEIAARYRVQEIAIDPAMSAGIVPRLQDMGLNVLHFRQGWLSMTPAIKETERALLAGKIRHGGHPVLRWNFANAVIDPGPTGDTARFSKAKSAEKIDGAVSAAMAISRAQASATGPSIFESDWIGNFSFA
ncbi:terminase TerL endonuclease subunit [Brevundimonas sp. 3P9-tot-E]|uniref:terminase large subunit n=1 Tax=unclassified Brevundimonas TaxID=2622653 RepID=UPI00399FEF9C